MIVAVTGGAGFLGAAVVRALLEGGNRVVTWVRAGGTAPSIAPRITVDLSQVDDIVMHLRGVAVVVHAAAAKRGGYGQQYADTVKATANLVDAMLRAGTPRLVAISSFAVYDWSAIPENSEVDERSAVEETGREREIYAEMKLLQEREFRRYAAGGGTVTLLRPGIVFGRGELWPSCIGHPLGKRIWIRMGPMGAQIPLVHVENCAAAIAIAATMPEVGGETFNLVDDRLPTRQEWLARLAGRGDSPRFFLTLPWKFHRHVIATLGRFAVRLGISPRTIPGLLLPVRLDARFKAFRYNNEKAKLMLGWQPRDRFEETLKSRSDA